MALDDIVDRTLTVLVDGFIRLIDYMGSEELSDMEIKLLSRLYFGDT